MSSLDLEKSEWSPRAPSERLLMTLKMQGAQTSSQIGKALGITGEAVRQQLLRLHEDGLVAEERRSRAGRGRPSTYWHLTDKAQDRFPDTHAALTVDILRSITEVLGEDALDRIIAARESATLGLYRTEMSDCTELRQRVAKLAELRNAEGYMATAEDGEDGAMLLIENHCPICAAATFCQGFCRAEKAVFQSVLGDGVCIERAEHIVAGGRRCTYVIREAQAE